jgi:hypothetical protein
MCFLSVIYHNITSRTKFLKHEKVRDGKNGNVKWWMDFNLRCQFGIYDMG